MSKTSQADIVAGQIYFGEVLTIESFMPQNGIIFSDGIQTDYATRVTGLPKMIHCSL